MPLHYGFYVDSGRDMDIYAMVDTTHKVPRTHIHLSKATLMSLLFDFYVENGRESFFDIYAMVDTAHKVPWIHIHPSTATLISFRT